MLERRPEALRTRDRDDRIAGEGCVPWGLTRNAISGVGGKVLQRYKALFSSSK
jgi:hypothetical protein